MARILLGISGSVTAYKGPELAREFIRRGHQVRAIITSGGQKFVTPLQLQALTGHPVQSDQWESDRPDGIDHIFLSRWADIVVVAPGSANTLARLAGGIADDLLTTTILAFDGQLMIAPSMNTKMLLNPATQANIATLTARGVEVLDCDEGELACGETGPGRMMEPVQIADRVEAQLAERLDYSGIRALVSAGPTSEPIDPVRVITNRSSGRMGFAIARALADRGATVRLVTGPTALEEPEGITETVRVMTTAEMAEALGDRFEECDLLIMAAAVADWRTAVISEDKLPRGDGGIDLHLEPTADIISDLAARKGDRTVIGFALESGDVVAGGRSKLERKGLDAIAVNDPTEAGAGPESGTNHITLIHKDGRVEDLPLQEKETIAHRLLDAVHAHVIRSRG
ncbi:bifunctional phosphopantothenoylcysteine decarboxylase/phosphopantothenate--cysteine ligase CoaBC [Gemmatimonadota bacterium]